MPDRQPTICLIVDNPLRDLEGLVLLGRQLASRGAKIILVPMYEQGFDVPAICPDLVLINYLRPNNSDLVKSYKRSGILIGVLDTEGIGGKDCDQFAEMVKSSGFTELVDLYCVWGQAQRAAFLEHGTVRQDVLHATGCPRFDFCAPPWRAALPTPPVAPGYVLINTNFPTVNPRFSTGSLHEEESMVQAGFSRDFARQFIVDGGLAYRAMLGTAIRLAKHFGDVTFVLRPHPFENLRSYDEFAARPNARVLQSGTSLEWISGARCLIHQNCSTAIEATMFRVEPFSLEWFNTPALRLNAATSVSRPAASEAELIEMVELSLKGELPPLADGTAVARREIVSDLFTAIDGGSASRVTDVVFRTIEAARHRQRKPAVNPPPSLRGVIADVVRRTLGYKVSAALRRRLGSSETDSRRAGKAFAAGAVNEILQRIDAASGDGRRFSACSTNDGSSMTRAMSGHSLQLIEAT